MATYTILNKRIKEKDLPDFTRQLFKNRQKDRRETMSKPNKLTREVNNKLEQRGHDWTGNKKMIKNMLKLEDEFMEKEKKVFEVSKEKFLAYKTVQYSGVTNMFDVSVVITYAHRLCKVDLTKEDCLYIMKNYGALLAEYQ